MQFAASCLNPLHPILSLISWALQAIQCCIFLHSTVPTTVPISPRWTDFNQNGLEAIELDFDYLWYLEHFICFCAGQAFLFLILYYLVICYYDFQQSKWKISLKYFYQDHFSLISSLWTLYFFFNLHIVIKKWWFKHIIMIWSKLFASLWPKKSKMFDMHRLFWRGFYGCWIVFSINCLVFVFENIWLRTEF